jgi:hypothetical protein
LSRIASTSCEGQGIEAESATNQQWQEHIFIISRERSEQGWSILRCNQEQTPHEQHGTRMVATATGLAHWGRAKRRKFFFQLQVENSFVLMMAQLGYKIYELIVLVVLFLI